MVKDKVGAARWAAVAGLVALVAGCGGGGGGTDGDTAPPPAPVPSLAGVAAVGAPLAAATVTLTDANGRTASATAGADGRYRFADLTDFVAPFQIQATTQLGETVVTHYALVGEAPQGEGVANITPLTTAIAALVGPTDIPTGLTPEQLQAIQPADLQVAATRLNVVIAPLVSALGVTTDFDPLTTPFVADGRGADLLLDHLDVSVAPSGVTVANKMAVSADGESTADAGSTLARGANDTPAPLAATDTTDTEGFNDFTDRLQACFAVPAAQRLVVSGGEGTLHADCSGLASADYLHNGWTFKHRWSGMLQSANFDGTVFPRPIVRLRVSADPERIAVNLNFRDAAGAGYTRPEIIERQSDGRWLMVGTGRRFNAFAEAQATYMNDLTPNTTYVNLNSSRVDTGFRFSFDPRASFGTAGDIVYHGLDLDQPGGYSTASWQAIRDALDTSRRMVGCVIVRGPGEKVGAKWSGIHPNGLLLKRGVSSTVQDYLAIDSIVSDAWRGAIDAVAAAADGSVAAPVVGAQTNVCGTGTTNSSSSTYTIDMQALGARKHPFTGLQDASIAGRDVAWNTGARYARMAPTGNVKSALESNPPLTFEVFDTDGRLRVVFRTRYLGRVPEVGLARAYVESRQVPEFSVESLRRYLDFASGSDSVTQTVTGSLEADWTTPRGAFGADRINMYAEVYRATPGEGIRGPLSRAYGGSGPTSSLWTSDPDLAAYLDALPGTNFYWWDGAFAAPVTGAGGVCSGGSLVSTGGVNVGRSTTRIGAESGYGGSLYGLEVLNSACLGPASHATVYREMAFRSYTDGNVRLWVATAMRSVRTPAP